MTKLSSTSSLKNNTTSFEFDTYIFDLDGTLIDSCSEVLKCLDQACKNLNIFVDPCKLNSDLIGPPLFDIVQNMVGPIDDQTTYKIIDQFRSLYDSCSEEQTTLFDGIYDTLKEIHSKSKMLFVATLKPKIPSIRILKSLGVIDFFQDIYTIDYSKDPMSKAQMIAEIISKYKLHKDRILMIGDDLGDILAAKQNGVRGAVALWGYGKNKDKIKQEAYLSLNSIKDLNI